MWGSESGHALRGLPLGFGEVLRYASSLKRGETTWEADRSAWQLSRLLRSDLAVFLRVLNSAVIRIPPDASQPTTHPVRLLYMKRTKRCSEMQPRQRGLFDPPRGGARPGAGRKPNKTRRRVAHTTRERVTRHSAVHVTQRVDTRGFSLRTKRTGAALRTCFRFGAERFGFRLIEYSIQRDHLHFIVEADNTRSLSRGMQGLKIRIAKALNRLWSLLRCSLRRPLLRARDEVAARGPKRAQLRPQQRPPPRPRSRRHRPILLGGVVRRLARGESRRGWSCREGSQQRGAGWSEGVGVAGASSHSPRRPDLPAPLTLRTRKPHRRA